MLLEKVLTEKLDQVTWLQLNWPPDRVVLSELKIATRADANWLDLTRLDFLVWNDTRSALEKII